MKRLRAALAAPLLLVLSVACGGKESPGPTPEPTAVVVVLPTAIPSNAPICYVPDLPRGTPPICKNAAGEMVTCPVDTSGLPACAK